MTPFPNNYRITLAAARVNANLTQAQIAEKMHVSKATIINWENNKVTPKPAQFKMFCELCGAPMDAIFFPAPKLKVI